MTDYTESGGSRRLRRWGIELQSATVQQWSPDPDSREKVDHLLSCLSEVARAPQRKALVFLDEMGDHRWPDVGGDGSPVGSPPLAQRAQEKTDTPTHSQGRIIGAMDALTGGVSYLDGYIVGRAKVIEWYQRLDPAYQTWDELFVVQDNGSIHTHADVTTALEGLLRITPVFLPTYAPWLNPIEKLWRWLRQKVLRQKVLRQKVLKQKVLKQKVLRQKVLKQKVLKQKVLKQKVLKLHRLSEDKKALRNRVRAFLDQFAQGSKSLLQYVGLLGEGKLARALKVL
jgi:hypothetical protein